MTKTCKSIEQFVAYDGKEFNDEYECLKYEKEMRMKNYLGMKKSALNCISLWSKACDALEEYERCNEEE